MSVYDQSPRFFFELIAVRQSAFDQHRNAQQDARTAAAALLDHQTSSSIRLLLRHNGTTIPRISVR
jgi:hypothetical protein